MNDAPTTVVFGEEKPSDAKLIQAGVAGRGDGSFRVEWVTLPADALGRTHSATLP
jgi:hypothetical protein